MADPKLAAKWLHDASMQFGPAKLLNDPVRRLHPAATLTRRCASSLDRSRNVRRPPLRGSGQPL